MMIRIVRTALLAGIIYAASTWSVVPPVSLPNRITLTVLICSLYIIFGYLGLDLAWDYIKRTGPKPEPKPETKTNDTDSMSTEVAEAIRLLNQRQNELDAAIDDLDVNKASGEGQQGPSPATAPEGFSSW